MTPDPPGETTSTSLIARVREHDPDAWNRLVRLYAPLVHGWLRQAGLRDADAADAFQEVFTAVAKSVGRFRRTNPGESFRAWLRVITKSKIADHHRRRGKHPAGEGGSDAVRRLAEYPDDLTEDDPAAAAVELSDVHRRALELVRAEFKPETWKAFWAVVVEGREVKDVAADLGVSASGVRMSKSRVLRRLKEEMAGLEP
jgi:RNA polymerase sigma-70 factor (ECF subfamily)